MDRRHRGWMRPALVLGVLGVVSVALVASPVSAHFFPKDEKKHVRKIARRIARKEARTIVQTTVGPTIFIEETELVRFGPINLNLGQQQTIGTFGAGSFTFTARCVDNAGSTQGIVELTTSRNNSAMESNDDSWFDFDTGDIAWWAEDTGDLINTGLQEINSEDDGEGHAWSPNGLLISGVATAIVTNPENVSADCSIGGSFLIVAPGTA